MRYFAIGTVIAIEKVRIFGSKERQELFAGRAGTQKI
jgi:hypothetical protein